jgi:hypothetical protein
VTSRSRLAAWLALLALCVRVLLPALHDHGVAHAEAGHACAHACADHGDPPRSAERNAPAADRHACAACVLLAAAPSWTPCEPASASGAAPPQRATPQPPAAPAWSRPIGAALARGPPPPAAASI